MCRGVVTTDLCRSTIRIGADQAGLTVSTCGCYPIDGPLGRRFDVAVFCPSTQCRNNPDSLMATDLALSSWSWKPCPRITLYAIPQISDIVRK